VIEDRLKLGMAEETVVIVGAVVDAEGDGGLAGSHVAVGGRCAASGRR